MKRSNELDIILDECLERMFAGESIEACLDSYPEHAAELAPLLEMAVGTREAVDITPRAEFRHQASIDFQNAVRNMRPARGKSSFSIKHWWVGVVAAIAVIVVAGGGTVAASTGSMPDGILYPVKTATENVRLAFAFSPESKAELYAEFADRRVDEIVAMADVGNTREIDNITDKLNAQLVSMVNVFGGDDSELMEVSASQNMDSVASYSMGAEAPPPESSVPAPTVTTISTTTVKSAPVAPGEKELTAAQTEGNDYRGVMEDTNDVTFRESVMQASASNSMKLMEAMDEAEDPVREALERALEVASQAYAYAISNIR